VFHTSKIQHFVSAFPVGFVKLQPATKKIILN